MKLKDSPIQRKLMSVMLLTSAVVLILMCSAYMILEYYTFRKNMSDNVMTLGATIASNSTAALAFDSPKDATEILSALRADEHVLAAGLYDRNGNLFAKYPDTIEAISLPIKPSDPGYKFQDSYIICFQPVKQGDNPLGTLYIKSGLEAMYAQLRHYALIGFLLICGSLIVAYVLSKLLQKTISEPIMALEQTARIISEKKDYSVRAVKVGKDEVGSLTDAFNRMLTQIHMQNREITLFNQKLEQKIDERTSDLRQQNEFVETILNSSVDLIGVFDKDLRYVKLNKYADELYPIKRDKLIGKNILEVFPELENSSMVTDLRRALNGETVHHPMYESHIVNRFFENYYIPLRDKDENVYGVLTIGHDITDTMEMNEKLRALNDELVKNNHDLSQFAFVASHDLQEPLRKIQTFTTMMARSFGNEDELKVYQGKINQSASRMQQLIRDVLNFSEISITEEAIAETDLNKTLENIRTDFELLIHEKEVAILSQPLPVIKGIPMQLSQLFSNIISNAIKYSDKKPVIKISSVHLTQEEIEKHQSLDPAKSYVHLKFEDNGIGFDPEFSERIFAIFQRLHGKQAYGGTGIGLALCKKIVENHGGIIYAESEPGKGSVFHVILPG